LLYRLYEGTHLIRNTESQLVAQAALVSAAYSTAISNHLTSEDARNEYGVPVNEKWLQSSDSAVHPIEPKLNKLRDTIFPRPLDAVSGTAPDPLALKVGQEIQPTLVEAKVITLAGIRVTDFNGVIVATSGTELGESLKNREDVQQALEGKYTSLLRERITDTPPEQRGKHGRRSGVRVFANLPIILNDRVLGVVVVNRTPPKGIEAIKDLPDRIVQASIALLMAVLFMSIFVSIKLNRPILAITNRAKQQIKGRQPHFGLLERAITKETSELSKAVAKMVNELQRRAQEAQDTAKQLQIREREARTLVTQLEQREQEALVLVTQLEQREREALETAYERNEQTKYARDLSYQVTHAFKTPITGINGATSLLKDGFQSMSDVDREHFLNIVEQDTQKLEHLVERLLELAKADYLEVNKEDLINPAITLNAIRDQYRYRRLSITILEDDLTVNMSEEVFENIVIDIIDNAYQHGGENTKVDIELSISRTDPNFIRILISDNGNGISPGNSVKIFQHFFSTRKGVENSGLGLSIVSALLRRHNGRIALLPSETGAHFQIDIPLAS
jgi:signal transduction histidine kinase